MSVEKIIKLQAKNHLKGNFTVIIAQVMLALTVFIAVLCAGGLAVAAVGIDTSTNLTDGQTITYSAITSLQYLALAFVLPMANGVCRSVCGAVRGRECRADDVLYYYRNGLNRFFKTLIVDIISVGLFMICAVLLNVELYFSLIMETAEHYEAAMLLVLLILPVEALSVFEIAAFYIIFIHYTFSAYGFSDKLPTGFYLWHMYGFALKNFAKAFKLILSMIGWILLCFFVLPAFYTVPYYLTASAMSARWSFDSDPFMQDALFGSERRSLPCWYRSV